MGAAGMPVSAHDLQIAATAIAVDFDVFTHNLRDFERIPGLRVRQVTW